MLEEPLLAGLLPTLSGQREILLGFGDERLLVAVQLADVLVLHPELLEERVQPEDRLRQVLLLGLRLRAQPLRGPP